MSRSAIVPLIQDSLEKVMQFWETKVETMGDVKEAVESLDARRPPVNQTSHGPAVHGASRPYHRAVIVVAASP